MRFIYIPTRGGVITPIQFEQIIELARKTGNPWISIGGRQELILAASIDKFDAIKQELKAQDIDYYLNKDKRQNIVSSYVATDIAPSTLWLTGGTYFYALEEFTYKPKLKVNVVDPKQSLLPLFFGELNFVASELDNYWFLILNLDGESHKQWPVLVATADLARTAQTIEEVIYSTKTKQWDAADLFETVSSIINTDNVNPTQPLTLPKGLIPYYEGLSPMPKGSNYWAGFYWRNNRYGLDFLQEMCKLCRRTDIARICFTPWKTFLVKDINPKYLMDWEQLIGRFGITMRHSALELNWNMPNEDALAFSLKRFLVRKLDKLDLRTYGLTFSIENKKTEDIASIIFKRTSKLPFLGRFDPTAAYDIYYKEDFNPNKAKRILYVAGAFRNELLPALQELSRKFYGRLSLIQQDEALNQSPNKKREQKYVEAHQCKHCQNVYDPRYGDDLLDIPAGIPFTKLPEGFACPVCEGPKTDYVSIRLLAN